MVQLDVASDDGSAAPGGGASAAVVAKRAFDHPEWVSLAGPVHGVAFLAYFALVIFVREEQRWGVRATLLALAAAVVPFGGYVMERRLLQAPAHG